MKKLIVVIFCLVSTLGVSQNLDSIETNNLKAKWVNSAQMGLLFDTNDRRTSGRISTSYYSGVSYGKFTGMLGIGLSDYYNYLMLPLVFEVQYKIININNSPFVYTNAGKGLIVLNSESFESNAYGGLNAGAGFGYQWNFGSVGLFVKGGYHIQTIRSKRNDIYYYDYRFINSFRESSLTPYYEVTRRMRRVVFTIGLNF